MGKKAKSSSRVAKTTKVSRRPKRNATDVTKANTDAATPPLNSLVTIIPTGRSRPKKPDTKRTLPDNICEIPTDAQGLHDWISNVLGIVVPQRAMLPTSASPFDYLCHTCFEDNSGTSCVSLPIISNAARTPGSIFSTRDVVVWANRGGGKTFMGAIATVLDLVFKPGIEVRVLAGSKEQSRRMFSHLRRFFSPRTCPELAAMVDGRVTAEGLSLTNGSRVEVLAQSHTSVRGTRVQKLRCDEVELFKPDVWEAAQFVTRSKACGGIMVHGSVECLSTMHLPLGLMHTLIGECAEGKRRLLRWGVMDVLETCGPHLHCGNTTDLALENHCPLWDECRGRAKLPSAPAGHVLISDAVSQKRRVSVSAWKTEMLCEKPSRKGAVVPEFDVTLHVAKFGLVDGRIVREDHTGQPQHNYSKDDKAHNITAHTPSSRHPPLKRVVAGMDFGMRSPTVVLFGLEDERGCLWIADEVVESGRAVDDHAKLIIDGNAAACRARGLRAWPKVEMLSVDPAGEARTALSLHSPVTVLRNAGLNVRSIRRRIELGVHMIASRLAPASGPVRLYVHERCRVLIDSLTRYRYASDDAHNLQPEKDGSDHAVDALRYLIVALDGSDGIKGARYAG